MPFTHFQACKNNWSDIVDEETYDDPIFNDIGSRPFSSSHDIRCDLAYDKPDRRQYLFTNIENIPIVGMYGNNMVTPARYRRTLNGYSTVNMVNSMKKANGKNDLRNSIGVFIVEYISIHHYADTNKHMAGIIKYYIDAASSMSNIKQAKQIREALSKLKSGGSTELRMVTFIPQEEILEKQYVYDPVSGILVCGGIIGDNVIHPNSHDYSKIECEVHTLNKNSITVDIIDNTNNTPYYTKVGKTIVTVLPTKDLSKPEGVSISPHINGNKQQVIKSSLEEANTLGVYRTYADCKVEGDINNSNLEEKLLLDKKRLDLDLDKLETENNKIKLEHERILLDYRKLEEERLKLALDRDLYKNKYKIGMLDIKKKILEDSYLITRYKEDLMSYRMKLNLDLNKYNLERTKSTVDLGSRVLSLATSIIKII